MKTNREKAVVLLDKLIDNGLSEQAILDYLINDYLEGNDAYQALLATEKEFFYSSDEDDDSEFSSKYKTSDEN
jgi:hypothetical protein